MRTEKKYNITWKDRLDFFLFSWIINWAYPEYYRPKYGYTSYRRLFFQYFVPQKIIGINRWVPWPVHFTSKVGAKNIKKGVMCDPGDNPNIYIQSKNGIIIGSNVGFGAGCAIISANHNHNEHSKHDPKNPIKIGDNVFVGSNSVILPGVEIGSNVVIGAGSVVVKNIPSNTIAVGNPCRVIKNKDPYIEFVPPEFFNRKIPEKLKAYFNE